MYKHNDLLEQLAEVGKTNDRPWEEFEWLNPDNEAWFPHASMGNLMKSLEVGLVVRIKPKTVLINGIECKDDWVKTFEECRSCRSQSLIYIESIGATDFCFSTWDEDTLRTAIERNIAHFTPEGAAMACKARYGIE